MDSFHLPPRGKRKTRPNRYGSTAKLLFTILYNKNTRMSNRI